MSRKKEGGRHSSGCPVTCFSASDCTRNGLQSQGRSHAVEPRIYNHQCTFRPVARSKSPDLWARSPHSWATAAAPTWGCQQEGKQTREGTLRIRCRGQERTPRSAPNPCCEPKHYLCRFSVPRTRCYGLNAVSPQFLCGNPGNPQWGGVRMWGLEEVIRSWR